MYFPVSIWNAQNFRQTSILGFCAGGYIFCSILHSQRQNVELLKTCSIFVLVINLSKKKPKKTQNPPTSFWTQKANNCTHIKNYYILILIRFESSFDLFQIKTKFWHFVMFWLFILQVLTVLSQADSGVPAMTAGWPQGD